MKHALEKSRTFPYIAWAGILAFGLMTIMLALQLDEEVTELTARKEYMESLLK